MKFRIVIGFALTLISGAALAQGAVQQSGPVVPNHGATWLWNGVVADPGYASGTGGSGVSEFFGNVQGTGTPPYANSGSGPLNTNDCWYDAPVTNATGYHYLCWGPNSQGGGLLAYGYGGAASPLPFQINVNGTPYTFPFAGTGTVTSISNSDSTLTLSTNPCIASCTVSVNQAHPFSWTAPATFGNFNVVSGTYGILQNNIIEAPSGGTGQTANANGFEESALLAPGNYSGLSCNAGTGVGCSFAFGLNVNTTLEGGATTILSDVGVLSELAVSNSFSGSLSNGLIFEAGDCTLGGGTGPLNCFQFFGVASTAYNGTTGTNLFRGLSLSGSSAAAGSGGNLTTTDIHLDMPTGSSSGTTQYGIDITGNGGSASTKYAIHDTSTAQVLFDGGVTAGVSTNEGPGTIDALTNYYLNGSALTSGGFIATGVMPAYTGDVTSTAGATVNTLATVNSNVGSFTNANITVNAKGLVTAAASGTSSSYILQSGSFGSSAASQTITFNSAVLAVHSVQIHYYGCILSSASATLGLRMNISGSDVTSGYQWSNSTTIPGTTTVTVGQSASDTELYIYKPGVTASSNFEVNVSMPVTSTISTQDSTLSYQSTLEDATSSAFSNVLGGGFAGVSTHNMTGLTMLVSAGTFYCGAGIGGYYITGN